MLPPERNIPLPAPVAAEYIPTEPVPARILPLFSAVVAAPVANIPTDELLTVSVFVPVALFNALAPSFT